MMNAVTYALSFRDERAPHEVKFALERGLSVLFSTRMEDDRLCMRAKATIVGAEYQFCLQFDAALQSLNCYSFTVNVSWPERVSSNADYYRSASVSWFALWTKDLCIAEPPQMDDRFGLRYRLMCEAAFAAERELDSVPAIQRAIVDALKQGSFFRTSHKEGGTTICWQGNRFVRADYGDYQDEKHFHDESEFFAMLLKFCHWDINQNGGGEPRSEVDTWRLIMRRLSPLTNLRASNHTEHQPYWPDG